MVAFGDHVPLRAVRGTPTCAVPVTDGATVFRKVPGATPSVPTDVATALSYPRWLTVTWTAMALRRSPGLGVYVVPVAPAIGVPSASHWKRTVPAGDHVPACAVSGLSTWATPETVGGALAVNRPGATSAVAPDFTRRVL